MMYIRYLRDSPIDVQEQIFSILRNVAESPEGIDMIFKNIPMETLLGHITSASTSSSDDVVLQATYLLANLINGSELQQSQIASHPQLLNNLRTCLAEGKNEVKRPATSCIFQLARNSKGRRAIIEAGIISTLRHLCEWSSNSGVSPSSSVSVGLTGGGLSGRGISPGGRNWGSTMGMSIGGSHSLAQWGGSSHTLPHYPYGNFHHHHHHYHHYHHHTHSSIYQPHSAAHQHGTTAMEDDKEVIQNARAALDWLDTYV